MAILPDLTQLTREELIQRLSAASSKLTLKVSDKGAISLYGVRRFPVTFYADEWMVILAEAGRIREFIAANSAVLAKK